MLSQDEFDFIFKQLDTGFADSAVNYDPVRVTCGRLKRPYRFMWQCMTRKLFRKHIGQRV